MKKTYFLININNLYFGKENNINGRIINPAYIEDTTLLAYTIEEIGYTTKNGAKKAMQKLIKQYKKENKKIDKLKIDGIVIKR